jgi:L-serine deaminase
MKEAATQNDNQISASMRRMAVMMAKVVIKPSPLSRTGLTAERVRQLTKHMK